MDPQQRTERNLEASLLTPEGKPSLLDIRREQAYNDLVRDIENIRDTGQLRTWFVETFQEMVTSSEVLDINEFTSLDLQIDPPELKRLQQAYNRDYRRPVLTMNIREYQAFCRKIGKALSSRGFTVVFSSEDIDLFFIVSTENSDFVYHELRHSVDRTREAENRILEEFYAYFGEMQFPRTMTIQDQEIKVKTSIQAIAANIGGTDSDRLNLCPEMTTDEFKLLARHVGEVLIELNKIYSIQELDIILHNTERIDQLERLLATKQEQQE